MFVDMFVDMYQSRDPLIRRILGLASREGPILELP